ncbi:MAG TPA: hypothetical protein VKA63_05410 [Candidatus Krumholzibacteria bacterium]|nr:hypothetical protein [Candidatus Krumholzibacteria bacterium]
MKTDEIEALAEKLEREVRFMQSVYRQPDAVTAVRESADALRELLAERDALRKRVRELEEALTLSRTALDLQRQLDDQQGRYNAHATLDPMAVVRARNAALDAARSER